LYRRIEGGQQNGSIELVGEGLHALSNQNRVPIFDLEANDSSWLMNKAAQLQLEHFNKSNALGWAITMGLFAMPVIYSDREWNQIVGESYFIQLLQATALDGQSQMARFIRSRRLTWRP
jgi:hypothetical protein